MFYYGIVEDIKDPKELGRVRVRVFAIHSMDKVAIPTDGLPWASVVQPTTSAANSGIGQSPRLLEGSLVMLTFADPNDFQFPIVVGSLPAELQENLAKINGVDVPRGNSQQGFQDPTGVFPKKEYVGDKDINKLARFDTFKSHNMYKTRDSLQKDAAGNDVKYQCANPPRVSTVAQDREDAYYADVHWSEPPIADDLTPDYPNNQVRESKAGIVEEWDDTPGQVRVHHFHPSGTYEEIIDDGSRTIKIVGEDYEMYLDGKNVYVDGNLNLTVSGDKRELIQGNFHLEVEGEMTMEVKESLQQKIGKDVATEIGLNRTENIGENEVRLINGEMIETIVKDEYHIVNGKQATQIGGDANFTYQANRKTNVATNDEEVVTGAKKRVVAQSEQVAISGGLTTAIKGGRTTSIEGGDDLDATSGITVDGSTIRLNDGDTSSAPAAARVGDTADTGDDPPGISGSDGTNQIETGSSTVFIGG